MIYLEKESEDYPLPRWEYEETLEYYLKTNNKENYDKPNFNYAKLDLEYDEEDYYLTPIGVGVIKG